MADLFTAEAVMDFWDSHATREDLEEKAEIEQIQKDIDTAKKYILDALARYRKDKTRSRSKKKGEDPFAELADYSSREDIHDSYGWGAISERECDRLMALWDLRENSKNKAVLEDRVTEIIQTAANAAWNPYYEKIYAYHQKRSKMRKEAKRVARENLMRG